ncbi:AAA family ATPase [Bacillus cereus group sp. BCN115]|uniref:AAA family ATPase n=1 Tax=Bacillus cereus group sp. BCN115 TaxID=3450575 RepID=UPI003F792348
MKKLLGIKNYGKFKDFKLHTSDWDGTFKKINLIYAPNGSGKTSISLLFESLKGNNDLILKKKNLYSEESPEIILLGEDNKQVKFANEAWNKTIDFIEVFNSFYLEDNVYIISPSKYNKTSISTIFNLEKDAIQNYKKEIQNLKKEGSEASRRVNYIHNLLVEERKKEKKDRFLDVGRMKDEMREAKEDVALVEKKIKDIFVNSNEAFTEELRQYKLSINKFLCKFSSDLLIKSIRIIFNRDFKIRHLMYDIEINGKVVQISDRNKVSLKYYLSEGDKNALSLSFFFAKFEMLNSSNEFIVVVDDPFTSFDSHRKMVTIKELLNLTDHIKQLFILTHDIHFTNDFINFSREEILTLQISQENGDSIIKNINIKTELLTGLMRDIMIMHNFIENGSKDNMHRIQIARCIRPTLEGLFRIKFYNHIKSTDWLGNFLEYIRDADEDSVFYRLKNSLESLEYVNDYSKGFHHSDSPYESNLISEGELKYFVQQTLELIQAI